MHCWRPQKFLEHGDRQAAAAGQFLEHYRYSLSQERRHQAYSLLSE